MHISQIKTDNILGARNINIETNTPVTLICGLNGAAKSSIQEAVRMALTAETVRVALKRDYPTMISEGAKTGSVAVITDIGSGKYELPSGKHTLEGDLKLGIPEALPFVLNAQAFATMPEEKRRTFLFSLTNCKVTTDEVRRRLVDKSCASDKIELTLPMLRSGFPAAAEFAAKKATEAKGAWKAITGETYGSKKAESWEAEKPEFDAERKELLEAELDAATEIANMRRQAIGAAAQRITDSKANAARITAAKALVDTLPRLNDKLKHEEESLATYKEELDSLASRAGTEPKTGLIHDLARSLEIFLQNADTSTQRHVLDGDAAMQQYTAQYGSPNAESDPDALAKIPAIKKSVELMERAVANTKRDIINAEAAKETAKLPDPAAANDDIEEIQASMAAIEEQIDAINAELGALNKAAEKQATADQRTKDAATHHEDVSKWLAVAESLAPDGIPAEMLAQALKPINKILRQSAIDTGWRQATITPDMAITAEGRAYSLLCESEKWRVDAMIAAAIAELSGVKVMMLDRMDVLDSNGRVELLMWLDDLATAGTINTALIFGTFKAMPSGLPESITPIWIDNGKIQIVGNTEAAA